MGSKNGSGKGKTKTKKAKAELGAFSPDRRGQLARLYAWLANDLVDWQRENAVGSETNANCPVVVQVHMAARGFFQRTLSSAQAAEAATKALVDNTRGVVYTDSETGGPFIFSEAEITALTGVMMEGQFLPLAPYRPVGAGRLLMW